METMRDVRTRMKSVRQTLKVISAMMLISTAKLRRARRRLEETKPYFEGIEEAMRDVIRHAEEATEAWFDPRTTVRERKVATLVVTSDKGLAGGYNANVLAFAAQNCPRKSIVMPLGLVGKRWFVERDYKIIDNFITQTREPALWAVEDLAHTIAVKFLSGEIDEFRVVYTYMHSVVKHEVKLHKLLPLSLSSFAVAGEAAKDSVVYAWHPDESRVFDALVPQYIKGILFGCIIEAFTSEQAARMMAMDAATKNAKDMIERLQLKYNRARQASITKEVTEIVSGASALED